MQAKFGSSAQEVQNSRSTPGSLSQGSVSRYKCRPYPLQHIRACTAPAPGQLSTEFSWLHTPRGDGMHFEPRSLTTCVNSVSYCLTSAQSAGAQIYLMTACQAFLGTETCSGEHPSVALRLTAKQQPWRCLSHCDQLGKIAILEPCSHALILPAPPPPRRVPCVTSLPDPSFPSASFCICVASAMVLHRTTAHHSAAPKTHAQSFAALPFSSFCVRTVSQ